MKIGAVLESADNSVQIREMYDIELMKREIIAQLNILHKVPAQQMCEGLARKRAICM